MQRQCSMCGKEMERNWDFCPYCGNMLSPMQSNKLMNMVQDMVNKLSPMFNNLISISGANSQPTNVKRPPTRQSKADLTRPAQKVDQVVEPMDDAVKSGNSSIHRIMLPDVTKRSDVTITRMENSLEIRAFAGKKLYMKIIPVDKRYRLSSYELSDGVLTVELKKN